VFIIFSSPAYNMHWYKSHPVIPYATQRGSCLMLKRNRGRNFIAGEVHTQNIVENVISLFYI
jgi:hypothetical protein